MKRLVGVGGGFEKGDRLEIFYGVRVFVHTPIFHKTKNIYILLNLYIVYVKRSV